MRFPVFSTAIVAVAIAGCTSQPATKPAPEVRIPAAPPANRAQAANTATAPAIAGYRTMVKDGVTLYCRNEVKTGSYLQTPEQCRTAEQIRQQEEAAHRALDDLRRNPIPGRP